MKRGQSTRLAVKDEAPQQKGDSSHDFENDVTMYHCGNSGCVALETQTFTTVDVPFSGPCQQVARINAAGDIVGAYGDFASGLIHGYLMTRSGFAPADFPGATGSRVNDINAKGTTRYSLLLETGQPIWAALWLG